MRRVEEMGRERLLNGTGMVPPGREFMIRGIFLSPLNTPISPSHSPRARAAAELAVDSRSIYSKHTHNHS